MFPSFFFFLFLLLPFVSWAQEKESLPLHSLTVREYTEFLQATAAIDRYSLYNEKMGDALLSASIVRKGTSSSYSYEAIPEHIDDPMPYVSRLSAKRYCNWLQNGKPQGEEDETTTEQGAYMLNGTMEEDPEKEEAATYFLPTSANTELDPTLASNLMTYTIVTHFEDSFQFNDNSEDTTKAWVVGGVMTGIIGIIAVTSAVLHNPAPLRHDAYQEWHDSNRVPITAQNRRNEEIEESRCTLPPHYEISRVDSRSEIVASTTGTQQQQIQILNPLLKISDLPVQNSTFASKNLRIPKVEGSSGSSSSSKKVSFASEVTEYYLTSEQKTSPLHTDAIDSSEPRSKSQGSKTNLDSDGRPMLVDVSSNTPTARQTNRKNRHQLISTFIDNLIRSTNRFQEPDKHVVLRTIQSHSFFFNQQAATKTPQEISFLRANDPSFFQPSSKPCWKNKEDHKKFLESLKKMDSLMINLISKNTVLFEASEAIEAWEKQIQEAKQHLEQLRKNFSATQFTTLAQRTFDHLLDFQNYIDAQMASGSRIYRQTHSLTPAAIQSLTNDKKAAEPWPMDENDSTQSIIASTSRLSSTDIEKKFSFIEKMINTLSLLSDHNLGETLRFLKFKEKQEQQRSDLSDHSSLS